MGELPPLRARAGTSGMAPRTARDGVGRQEPAEICEQIEDPARNGGKKIDGLIDHIGKIRWWVGPGRPVLAVLRLQAPKSEAGAFVEAWASGAAYPK